ncbi:RNA-binding transcriptional accessory protein [Brevibacillus laterosporus]|uniref:30S ribosomal protein S1 n=1 Tax=Brevibacillus laterosporus LMG 15441 TaxID=1042163 RepID=A0A075QZ09_BRELA|nr:Tex family protein [Brevibacillus laterosporus]AIG24809.1 30S ribosomal protein S1 [Brevibacillus laterosporus LMG 15441]RJL07840.1 RNA-binding transcriptional accessory protein [Brevibacillus laterosporus]TPH13001.1 RNA-binding transcriptional accessory protein [Brevibacillus laterosporus]HAS01767.1 RNA-binding transcriptional accessory protein [Brevibacillus sp.]
MDVKQMAATLARELGVGVQQVVQTITLLDEGNTVPFISRYRKEMTGQLDETQIRTIEERVRYLRNLIVRKEEVLRLIEEQGKLTEELSIAIQKATKLQEVEDLYRPYKQKRRTRATIAKEKGLEPLAAYILSLPQTGDPSSEASRYIDTEKGVETAEDALQGAMDIIAEQISDDAEYRKWIREKTFMKAILLTEQKEKEEDGKNVYEMYYSYSEPVKKVVPHRVLAINRGEKEGILKVSLETPGEDIIAFLQRKILTQKTVVEDAIKQTIEDSYKRLIAPSIEREVRNELTEVAEERAIHIFAENLRNLLLQPPFKGKVVLGVDPAFRTGCKLAVVDDTGKKLYINVIYPTPPVSKVKEASETVKKIIDEYQVDVVAIGNGTASRETEQFIADVLKEAKRDVSYIIVNEAGASVYSASALAKEEFPELDVAERSAISIARRLQDPLAELVKIDPKSVGVGQYQHDVSQTRLAESLEFVVSSAVNHVGVDVNTASASLLQYVSGVNKQVASNIVKLREENGKFSNRSQLKKVPRLGAKTYEQCIGFLRVMDGENSLDRTPIHPESYEVTYRLLTHLQIQPEEIGSEACKKQVMNISLPQMAAELEIGEPTLKDIVDSLLRPGRDPRDELPKPLLSKDVLKITDLSKGMKMQGTIRNVVDFGAFVDIGLKNDGLIHISQLKKGFVKHPLDVVAVGDIVDVWVMDIDEKRQRVGMTMISPEE